MRDDEIRRFRRQLKSLQRRLRQELPSVDGLSRSAVQVSAVIARREGVTPREVGEELRMTSSNVAAALRELEGRGYLVRERDREDGRRVNLSLTEEGARSLSEFRAERDTWLGRAIAAQLSDEEVEVLKRAGDLVERLARFTPGGSSGTGSATA
ncbi:MULTISPECIES: MarR family winged helix-turn-helix transcriptional regulator [Streptomyces]|uniref:MarR family winged helix-turn-helix transcriptional regulator n=1 Tax=Streptomyces TaxID=1883 RepID=UPI0033AEB79B